MEDEIKRGRGRPRKNPEDKDTTGLGAAQDYWDTMAEIDERKPDRRPATPTDITGDEVQVAADNRQPAGDEGKALNQMAGRVAITENADPTPWKTMAENPPPVANPSGPYEGPKSGGMEIQLVRGYQPEGDGPKRMAGEVLSLPSKEAKRLINLGAARFTEEE